MAGDIAWATSPGHQEHGDLLVMLQSFGTPKGNSAGWLQAADAIQRLGGNAQVFAQMNQGDSDEPHQGRFHSWRVPGSIRPRSTPVSH